MKAQYIIYALLLMGLVGIESLKKEQLQHLWFSISGYSLPVAVMAPETKDPKCPLLNKKGSFASSGSAVRKVENATYFLLHKPCKAKFLSCKNLQSAENSNVL